MSPVLRPVAASMAMLCLVGCVAPMTEQSEAAELPGETRAALRLSGGFEADAPYRLWAVTRAIGYGDECSRLNTGALKYWWAGGLGIIAFLAVPRLGTPVALVSEVELQSGQFAAELPMTWAAWAEATAKGGPGRCEFSSYEVSLYAEPIAQAPASDERTPADFARLRPFLRVRPDELGRLPALADARTFVCEESGLRGLGCKPVFGAGTQTASWFEEFGVPVPTPEAVAGQGPTVQEVKIDFTSRHGLCRQEQCADRICANESASECAPLQCDVQRDCLLERRSYSSSAPVAIEARGAREVQSEIVVPDAIDIRLLDLSLDLEHFQMTDTVTLSHEGREVVLIANGVSRIPALDGSLSRHRYLFPMTELEGSSAAGTWSLVVTQGADPFFSGTLHGWRLDVYGARSPSP